MSDSEKFGRVQSGVVHGIDGVVHGIDVGERIALMCAEEGYDSRDSAVAMLGLAIGFAHEWRRAAVPKLAEISSEEFAERYIALAEILELVPAGVGREEAKDIAGALFELACETRGGVRWQRAR